MATILCLIVSAASTSYFMASLVRGLAKYYKWDGDPYAILAISVFPLAVTSFAGITSMLLTPNYGVLAGLSIAVLIPALVVVGVITAFPLVATLNCFLPRVGRGVEICTNGVSSLLSALNR